MKKCLSILLGIGLVLATATPAAAQEKKEVKAKEDRLSGVVHMINKDTSTITLRRNNVQRQVVYDANTRFSKMNKPGGSLDDIKEGVRVICLGKFDEKARLVATRIDVRAPK